MSRSSVPTLAQQQRLLECLEEQRWLATGHARTSNARERTSAAWQEIANKLNSDGRGCIKSAKQWTKYWKDKKSAVRKKYRQIRLARMQTGGGGAEEELVLSAIEDRIVALMGGERFAVGDRELEINPFHPSTNESEAVPAAPPLEIEEEVQLVIQDVVTDSDATASESVLQDLIESMAVEPGTSVSTGQRLSIAPTQHTPAPAPITARAVPAPTTPPASTTRAAAPASRNPTATTSPRRRRLIGRRRVARSSPPSQRQSQMASLTERFIGVHYRSKML